MVQFFVFLGLVAAFGVALLGPVYFFPGTFAAQAANQTLATVNPRVVLPVVSQAGNFLDNINTQTVQLIETMTQPTPTLVSLPEEYTKTEKPVVTQPADNGSTDPSLSPNFVITTLTSILNPLINSPREVLIPQTVRLDNNEAVVAGAPEVKAEVATAPPLVVTPIVAIVPPRPVQPAAPVNIALPANLPAGDFIWPVKGYISQGFSNWHPGIDIVSPFDTPVYAAGDGVVQVANYDSYGLGKHIVLGHALGYTTTYAHLDIILVSPGQTVTKGSLIGKIGLTGRTTGPHLHFEMRHNGSALSPLSLLH